MKNIRGICALCREEQIRTSTPSLVRISFDTFTTSKHNASKYIHMGQQQHFCIHFLLNLNLSFVYFFAYVKPCMEGYQVIKEPKAMLRRIPFVKQIFD